MTRSTAAAVGIALGLGFVAGAWWGGRVDAPTASPYVEQLDSPVRGLSAQEVNDLLTGAGAGFARSAELNGYPGPRHVLDLAGELGITADQRALTDSMFAAMNAEARRLGAEIVAGERRLSHAFAEGGVDPASLRAAVDSLGALYAQLRDVHLTAHLALRPLLTAEQLRRYDALRGYTTHERADPEHRHEG